MLLVEFVHPSLGKHAAGVSVGSHESHKDLPVGESVLKDSCSSFTKDAASTGELICAAKPTKMKLQFYMFAVFDCFWFAQLLSKSAASFTRSRQILVDSKCA